MTYAFQTPEKLCFILDLMNGGDLHYHLTQHNVFSESEVRFYAAEVILGLEHMHNRFIVYRDLKVFVWHSVLHCLINKGYFFITLGENVWSTMKTELSGSLIARRRLKFMQFCQLVPINTHSYH
ncbi:unnamed protein product [Rodentolepis nana]|uniref:Protein kinase domain-containing protein n=1 Tax=Rodentolepis nana TaxID=102285 RepID=A0A0R3TTL6_RODNA|nr:unnamed protein product [Rodentolepis nana]